MKINKLRDKGFLLVLFFMVVIIAVDRVSKEIVWRNYRDLVVWNSGIALGFLTPGGIFGKVFLQSIIVLAIISFVFWLSGEFKKKSRNYFIILPLGVVVAGGVSNLFDRVFWGSVLDFIPFLNLWTFNIADLAISSGIIALILGKLFYESKNA